MAVAVPNYGRRGVLAAAFAGGLSRPALAQGNRRTLRVRPVLDLASLDPLWGVSTPSFEAAFMIYDSLYGLDDSLTARPQMVESHELSDNRLTWRFKLRDGLAFHDGEQVLAKDAVSSIARWMQRDRVGVVLKARINEMRPVDDRQFEIRLKTPFPKMQFSLAQPSLFVLPARIVDHTDAFTEVKEYVGSGPFVFLKDEWVSGARSAFRRNERYQPRDEAPSVYAGGKRVHFDRVEWITIPDPLTAVNALRNGEIDWMERPLADLLPQLRESPGVVVDLVDRFGAIGMIVLNNKIPPFDNAKLRRALLFGVDQSEFLTAAVGEGSKLVRLGVGLFPPGTPFATDAGLEVLSGQRDMSDVRRLVAESGYRGEKIVIMVPTDAPSLAAFGHVAHQMMLRAGLKVEYQAMDWATLVSRRNQVETGGWHCYSSLVGGFEAATPATHWRLVSFVPDPQMVALNNSWFDAEDLPTQQRIAEQMQRRFFEDPPFLPLGQYFQPFAYRAELSDAVRAPISVFWGVRKA